MATKYPKYKVAGVQAAPVYMNIDKSVEKACKLIAEAAENGAKLVAFPEGFLPGYPWWVWMGDPIVYGMKFYQKLYENAVTVPGPELRAISECAKANDIFVCVSATERDAGSLYLTQFWFDNKGDLMGKHRKLKPSGSERLIWGDGNGSTVRVFNTELGNLGGLQCWEHIVPLNLVAMNSMNEQVHVSAWPSFLPGDEATMSTIPCEILARYYALATQTFTIMTSQIYTQEMVDMIAENDFQRNFMQLGGGCTQIIGPNGMPIAGPLDPNEEGIVYADIDLAQLSGFKYLADPAGHYSVPSLSMNFDQSPAPVVRKSGEPADDHIAFEAMQEQ